MAIVLTSFLFLSIAENRQHRIKNGWFLYFENPKNDSMSFVIENYSDDKDFSWSLIVDGKKIKMENIKILKNDSKNVMIQGLPEGNFFEIKADHGKEEKNIYKKL